MVDNQIASALQPGLTLCGFLDFILDPVSVEDGATVTVVFDLVPQVRRDALEVV